VDSLVVLNCDGCGLCCMHMSSPPFHEEEWLVLPPNVRADYEAALDASADAWEVHGIDARPCGWFDMVTRKCRHHEFRPEICRDFEVGGEACLGTRGDRFSPEVQR